MELLVNKVEKRTTKSGKSYWLINDEYYVWSNLNLTEGNKYNIEVDGSGRFPKITKATLITPASNPTVPPPARNTTVTASSNGVARDEMVLSYAKDIGIEAFSLTECKNPFNRAIDIAIAARLAYIILMDRHKPTEEFAKDVKLLRQIASEFGIQDIEETEPDAELETEETKDDIVE